MINESNSIMLEAPKKDKKDRRKRGERKRESLSTSMEVYSRKDEDSDKKIFKNKLLKEITKDDDLKVSKVSTENKSTPKKKGKIEKIVQENYQETKIVKENEPNTKETFMSIKSKIVYGGDNSKDSKNKNSDSNDKKSDIPSNEKKKVLLNSTEIGGKQSEEDLIAAELKKLSENKNKLEKNSLNSKDKEKTKKTEVKQETEISRNLNDLPKKENIDSDYLNKKKKETNEKNAISTFQTAQKSVFAEEKLKEKVEISNKTTKKVNLQEPIKSSDQKKRESQLNKRRKTGGFELKNVAKFAEERFDIEKIRRIENEAAESIQVYFKYYLKKTNNKSVQTAKNYENEINMQKVFEVMLQISSLVEEEKKRKKIK